MTCGTHFWHTTWPNISRGFNFVCDTMIVTHLHAQDQNLRRACGCHVDSTGIFPCSQLSNPHQAEFSTRLHWLNFQDKLLRKVGSSTVCSKRNGDTYVL
jgi:hypothetical protein